MNSRQATALVRSIFKVAFNEQIDQRQRGPVSVKEWCRLEALRREAERI